MKRVKKKKEKINKNGKGDSPRNVSDKFKENYDKIVWKKNDSSRRLK
jgi:hypothetical protein